MGDKCTGADQTVVPNPRAIEYRGAHSDENAVTEGAAVENGMVTHGAVVANPARSIGVGMHHRKFLDVAACTHGNLAIVRTDHGIEPDACGTPYLDASD